LREQEIRVNKYHNNRLGIPAEKEKLMLKTKIMSYVHENDSISKLICH